VCRYERGRRGHLDRNGIEVHLGRLHLLVVGELGYTPVDNHQANLLVQLVSHLYTRVSLVVTTNVSFQTWGAISGGDDVIALPPRR